MLVKNDLKGTVKIRPSILSSAMNNNPEALETMFRQFIPDDEEIYVSQYLGLKGLWGVGAHSFTCLTRRRVADISVGRFGEVIYQDGYLEFINSSIVFQPSKLALYFFVTTWFALSILLTFFIFSVMFQISASIVFTALFSIIALMFCLFLIPFIVKIYYSQVKCGIVFWIKEGVPIYIFANRKFIVRANMFCREVTLRREARLKALQETWR